VTVAERPTFDAAEEQAIRRRVKDELRTRLGAIRRAVPADARAARAARIVEHVRRLPEWTTSRVGAAYGARRGEADPPALVAEARAAGRTVVLPRTDVERDTITWHVAREDAVLERGSFGVLEPPANAELVQLDRIDLVLVPAIAVDERGHRLGHGRGFYDRALRDMPRARRCALVFAFQRLAEIPDTEGDERVHVVVTDEGVYEPV
jgi:5-formyltetrahydrofolate cyclo-ligase